MKKQSGMLIKNPNERKVMITTNHPTIKKTKQYIYTEADLGEGLLDEGIIWSIYSLKKRIE